MDYEHADYINIYLFDEHNRSSADRTNIMLYKTLGEDFIVLHELTHSLLGYGNNFSSENGFITQEGYADYLQYKYGDYDGFTYSMPVHKKMNYLIKSEKNIPLYKLVEVESANNLYSRAVSKEEDVTLDWIFYVQAGSFVTFLIDTYGIDKFELIYNQPELPKQIKSVYNMELADLESEWLQYVTSNSEPLSVKELSLPIMDYHHSRIDLIDEEIFQRDSN